MERMEYSIIPFSIGLTTEEMIAGINPPKGMVVKYLINTTMTVLIPEPGNIESRCRLMSERNSINTSISNQLIGIEIGLPEVSLMMNEV